MLNFLRMIGPLGNDWLDVALSSRSVKTTYSISPSDTCRWAPDGKSGELAMNAIVQSLNVAAEDLERVDIEGENSLLLIKKYGEVDWSFAIRNSGTESKTRVTIRNTGGTKEDSRKVMEALIETLEPILWSDPRS